MATIRHICDGHEYRYDTDSGQVRNNYGRVVSVLLFHKFAPAQCPFVASVYPADAEGKPSTRYDNAFAILRSTSNPSDQQLAEFAIGHTAASLPEAR